MSHNRIVLGALGAAAIVATSAVALATTDVSFDIVTEGSSIRIGVGRNAKTFPIGAGQLIGQVGPQVDGVCSFGVSAARSNPTFQKVRVNPIPPIDAQLELCDDVTGQVGDTTSGVATMTAPHARIKVKLTGIGVNCEVPCVDINFSSTGSSDAQDYTPSDGTVKLVDEGFAVGKSTCGVIIDGILGLPSEKGKNGAILSLQAPLPAPACEPAPPPPADGGDADAAPALR